MGDTIIGVQFGIANPEDIRKRSVVEVTTDKTTQSQQPVPNGVFDARFGVIENGKVCPTCKQTNQLCPGHFGHIQLARPVYLYQFFDTIEKLANLVCLNCSKPLLEESIYDGMGSSGMARFKEVRDTMKRPDACMHCDTKTFSKVAKVIGKAATLEGLHTPPKGEEAIPPTPIQVEMIMRAFQRITNDDCKRLGFNPIHARPEWMICTVLAVPPLTVRPSVVMDDHQRMEDDLTHQLISIIRSNDRVRDKIDKGESAEIIDKFTALLQYNVAAYVDNDIKGMAPTQQRSGRPLRTLKSRFGAKTGRVRGNLMGKRVDFSARSVITPDANIDLDELGVPEEIAINLTFPETVSPYNRERLLGYVRNGPDKHPGAKSVYIKRDKNTFSLRYVNPDTIDIKEGDVVHRHLIDGDIVLFNRQPSLHKASMMSHRVKVLPYSTFRLNVSATRPYNADFDGDEMNMHVPQSIAAATELRFMASVLRNIISPRTSSPIIQLFQDTMTGAYRISQAGVEVPEHIAMNILARIRRPFVRKNRNWSGAEIISAALPMINFNEKGITLTGGELTSGVLKKSATSGLIHVVYNDFGPIRCGQLINDIQSIVTQFNMYTGFSVGTSDLIADAKTNAFVKERIAVGRQKVADILSSVHAGKFMNNSGMSDGEKLEDDVSSAMKEVVNKINTEVIDSLKRTNGNVNRIVQMVDSGSKGSEQNITQMVAALGQQLIEGKRVQYTLQDRTLPHFARYEDGVESRGFVEHSFVDGLLPAEFFYHAQAGREGLIDTAVKTSDTGYIQRRLMKTMEDQHIEYDGTVRNVNSSIVQFNYGDDGMDTVCVENQICNLTWLTMENIYSEYALTPGDVNPFLKEEVEEAPDMVDEILIDRALLHNSVFRHRKTDILQAPVNLKRMIEKYNNPYSTKTDLTPRYVVSSLGRFMKEFPENKVFHVLLRFYLAPKKSIVIHRLSQEMFDELMRDIRFKYIQSQVHAGEMVGALAAQSIGEPTTQLTLNSIAYDERVWVRENGDVHVVKIGEFIEEWVAKSDKIEHHPNHTTLAYLPPGWETMSVDEDGKIEWRTLEAVTQHPPVNEDGSNTLVKVTTRGGRTVLATKAKSFLTRGVDGKLVPTRGDELRIGCEVPLMADFPTASVQSTIHVSDFIENGLHDRMPDTIELTESFGWFIGAYLAEGMANEHQVSISNNDPVFRDNALTWTTSIGLAYRTATQTNKIKDGWTSTDHFLHCTQLARFLIATCGRGSLNKHVPEWAYTAPESFVRGLLSAYLSGDGTVGVGNRRCVSFTSISEPLLDGISALLTRVGVHTRKSREMTHKTTKFKKVHTFWQCRIPINECVRLRDFITLIPAKQVRLDAITPTEIVCARSDFQRHMNILWDRVTTIEEMPCPGKYVYDFTVEGTRNFVHANGLCLRDTFHSAGTAKANATSGVPRIEELLSASSNPKRPSNTVYLMPDAQTSQEAAVVKMKEIQKTTLRDITKSVRIFYDPYPLAESTVVPEDREMLARYEQFSCDDDGGKGSPWIMRLEMNEYEMARRNIMDPVEIQTKLMSNASLKMIECRYSDPGAEPSKTIKNLVMRIMFDPDVVKNPIQMRFLEDKLLNTSLTGVSGIGRVHIRSVKNEVMYDPAVGGYKPIENYVLDVEGTNLYDLLVFPGVDGTRTFSSDIHEVHDVFGIETARLSLYEEINEVFSTEKVNYRHLAVLVDTMTFSGRIVPVNRFGMSKNETGVLAKSSFEETSKIMFNAAMWAEKDSMRGVSANIMFGQKPPCGTGFVDILVDESRLPEGEDELGLEDETLDKVNQRLESMPVGECKMEDILMDW